MLEAVALAASQAFEVIYYPRGAQFCVNAHSVETALQQNWRPGLRFKMAVDTEDALTRMSWFMGSVAKIQDADPLWWPKSPWKILQVTWDEPELLQLQGMVDRVSPWQVELVRIPPAVQSEWPPFSFPKKKVRFSLSRPSDEDIDGASSPVHAYVASDANSLYDSSNVPAGMQGARHDERNHGFPNIGWTPTFHPTTASLLHSFYPQRRRHPDGPHMHLPAAVVVEGYMETYLKAIGYARCKLARRLHEMLKKLTQRL